MKKLIYTLCFIGPFSIAARAQITNGQINYEMRADEFRQGCDNDFWSDDDNIVRLTLGGDANTGGTTTWNTAGSGTCGGAYVRRWGADAPSSTSAPNTLLYTATGRANVSDAITLNIQSWESDNGFNCTPVGGDDCRWGPNGYAVTFKSAAKTPCRWWGRNGTIDNSDYVSGGDGDAKIKTVWRYTQGNSCGNALNFGTLASATTYSHVNSNRAAPAGASASMGYTNNLGDASPDVYYRFVLSEPATVVISTDNAATNYDTKLHLYNSTGCGTEIAVNDDINGSANRKSRISTDLCAGTYAILVEGYSTNNGDFNLTVLATSLAITGGSIGGITNGGMICYNTDPGAFTETAAATGLAGFSYQWEQSTVSASSGFGNISGATGNTYDPGNLTVTTWYRRKVTDACGREAYSNVIQVLIDNIAPTISCPGNISVNTEPGICGARVTYTAPVGTDNCPGATTARIAGPASGVNFPIGATTVTHRVTASNGQTTDCSFTVTVTDNEAPAISCPANISVNASPGTCGATVTYTAPVGTDNCPGASTVRTAGLASGATFPVGTTTVTHRVTAFNNQTTDCSFTVTVTDNEAPAISCPANISVNTSPGTCGATVTYTAPVGTDNCSGATTARIAGLASGATFPVGTTTVTHRVTASNNQTADCSFTVTVTDNEAPTISCPANISVNTSPGTCGATVTYTAPVGTDNCSGASTARIAGLASGATFPVGTTTVTHRVTASNNQTTDCSFTVTVTDNEAPVISCPGNVSVCASNSTVNYTAPVGTDNCPGSITAQTAGLPSGSAFPLGSTTNTFSVSNNGQTTYCSFDVTVVAVSVAPASVSGGTSICPGGSAILSVSGGSLGPGSVWEWFSGSCGGTPVGTGSSITVSPSASTNYYVRASANASCAASSCQSTTVTVSPGGSSLAVDLSTKTCRVRNNNYVHFYDGSGRLILSVNSNGQDLGDVDVTAYVNAGGSPIDVQACGSSLPQFRAASLGRHWKVTPQLQPTNPVSVRLYFDAAEEANMAASANANANPDDDYSGLSNMDLSKYSNPGNPAVIDGSFSNNCSGGITSLHVPGAFGDMISLFTGFSPSGRYTEYSFTGFSELWLSGTNNVNPLPIELTAFAGTCEDAKVFLAWSTASEINNERFVLERSANLAEWTNVGELPGAGNSNQPRSYQFTDERPLNGLSYYRLTQYDYDGASETFSPASVLCQSKGPGNRLSVYPNPASDRFTVSVDVEKTTDAVLEVLDMTGKPMLRKNLNLPEGENRYTFDRTGIPSGQYLIRLKAPGLVLKPIKLIIE